MSDNPHSPKLTLADIDGVVKAMQAASIKPIDGHYYYLAPPGLIAYMRSMQARWNYRRARHIARWEKRYGRPYPDHVTRIVELDGVRFCD